MLTYSLSYNHSLDTVEAHTQTLSEPSKADIFLVRGLSLPLLVAWRSQQSSQHHFRGVTAWGFVVPLMIAVARFSKWTIHVE